MSLLWLYCLFPLEANWNCHERNLKNERPHGKVLFQIRREHTSTFFVKNSRITICHIGPTH